MELIMTYCLLRFDSEAEAIAALANLRVTPPTFGGERLPERWADTTMPVALVTSDAVLDMSGEETVIISPRQQLADFWLLAATGPDLPGVAAEIEPETGRLLSGDETVLGARIDPVFAGMAAVPLWMERD
jgi:hypothetical protein